MVVRNPLCEEVVESNASSEAKLIAIRSEFSVIAEGVYPRGCIVGQVAVDFIQELDRYFRRLKGDPRLADMVI